jgi:hypothetical protein
MSMDRRAEWMLRDPQGYFSDARKRIRAQVEQEMRQERKRERQRTPWWKRWLV